MNLFGFSHALLLCKHNFSSVEALNCLENSRYAKVGKEKSYEEEH